MLEAATGHQSGRQLPIQDRGRVSSPGARPNSKGAEFRVPPPNTLINRNAYIAFISLRLSEPLTLNHFRDYSHHERAGAKAKKVKEQF